MAGVPHHKVDVYLRALLKKGIAVVKQDQAIFFLHYALPHS
jgi:DNA mismatch repair ATPase MutS